MLVVASLLVLVVTFLEVLILRSFGSMSPPGLLLVIVANASIVGIMGYFVFAAIRVPRAADPPTSHAMGVVIDTLPLLRRGLNPESAAQVARVMATFEGVGAVVIADSGGILACEGQVGPELDRALLHRCCRQAASTGRSQVVKVTGHPAVITALQSQAKPIGAIGLVGTPDSILSGKRELERFATVLAELVSMQAELGQLDRQTQLVTEAELNALRAQINPHFLFNALNTIISYSRDDPETTRRLLIRLADLFRGSMQSSGQTIPFADEYTHIKNYLYIEQARFRDRLHVIYDLDPQVLKIEVPALSVQPLVENAVRHGLSPKAGPGTLRLKARVDFLAMRVVIAVSDDGVGLDPARIPQLLKARPGVHRGRHGVGLANINERLRRLYGEAYSLVIESSPGVGTNVTLRIPMR
ncbi:MAG TPA: histidine kinase [Symbiobacteriaceae bacterium]|nr:histidine kinase [Symbiobacteriaceae bacterium]